MERGETLTLTLTLTLTSTLIGSSTERDAIHETRDTLTLTLTLTLDAFHEARDR